MKEVSQTVFETEWFNVERVTYPEMREAASEPYYRINSPDGIIILAMTDSGKIILVRQFRPALGVHTLEFPAGAVDTGESPAEAAARELAEETGFQCARLDSLGAGHLMLNRHRSLLHGFFGRGATRVPMPGSPMETLLVSPQEFRSLVLENRFDQYAALALLARIEWQLGVRIVE